ncbi:unnamed protein product [Fraxinus pennsylvanica]|uniref:Transposase n=1 Tax=Fraxinus pennsylvanica TaxID=56036 RepID=A0AAD1ZAV3_9LAMI|nr:unnamed protein product [Fraxinus pennsylvanica]
MASASRDIGPALCASRTALSGPNTANSIHRHISVTGLYPSTLPLHFSSSSRKLNYFILCGISHPNSTISSLLQIPAQKIEAIYNLLSQTAQSDLNHGCKESYSYLSVGRKTPISITNDKDLKRMIKFYGNSDTAEIYIMNEEIVAPDVSNMPGSRSSRTTLSEAPPADASPDMIVDDINEPGLPLDPTFDVVVDTSHVEAHFDVPTERPVRTRMPVPISFVGYDEKDAKAAEQWLNIITDREKGLKESIAEIFQNDDVYHSFCLTHLSEQFMRDLKGQFSHEVKRLMVEDFYGAAHALTPEGFQRCVESIKNISIEAYNWIVQSEPVNWANAFFRGARYNHMTSNFGELIQSWLSDAHELPIIQMVDAIRGKIMELIYTRQTESNHWQTRLTPSMEEKLEKENIKVRTLQLQGLAAYWIALLPCNCCH